MAVSYFDKGAFQRVPVFIQDLMKLKAALLNASRLYFLGLIGVRRHRFRRNQVRIAFSVSFVKPSFNLPSAQYDDHHIH